MNPRYPVYIISKGRWKVRLTSRALERMGVPYLIVVEPQEYDQYAAVIDPAKILTTPFSNLGQGSIPVRNFVWEHSIEAGAARHWCLDDNVRCWYRVHRNHRYLCTDGTAFHIIETWTDRYTNVGLSGFQYSTFVPRKGKQRPLLLNTRVYSMMLIDNSLPFRWRGRYNEDTDLSLRVLKHGWVTCLFRTLVGAKAATMTMKGGNTDELYQGDGRVQMALSLVNQHPDVVTVSFKWGRYQHKVDYSAFRANRPRLKPGVVLPDGPDEFGMTLKEYGKQVEA